MVVLCYGVCYCLLRWGRLVDEIGDRAFQRSVLECEIAGEESGELLVRVHVVRRCHHRNLKGFRDSTYPVPSQDFILEAEVFVTQGQIRCQSPSGWWLAFLLDMTETIYLY
jgi:hypothetical protein